MKTLLFSLTEKDFDFHYFTVGGNGGGGKDTSNTGDGTTEFKNRNILSGRDSNSRNDRMPCRWPCR